MKASPQLQIPAEPFALPDPASVSEVFREYAEPLLYIDPAGPADLQTMRTSLGLAMICWNLPVYEAIGSPLYAQGMKTLDKIKAQVPAPVATCLQRLLEDRKTKFAQWPFLTTVELLGDDVQSALIAAEARRPKTKPAPRA